MERTRPGANGRRSVRRSLPTGGMGDLPGSSGEPESEGPAQLLPQTDTDTSSAQQARRSDKAENSSAEGCWWMRAESSGLGGRLKHIGSHAPMAPCFDAGAAEIGQMAAIQVDRFVLRSGSSTAVRNRPVTTGTAPNDLRQLG